MTDMERDPRAVSEAAPCAGTARDPADRPLRILLLEPFLGGSHAAFARALQRHAPAEVTVLGMAARHWKWRMRGSALHFAGRHRDVLEQPSDVLLAGSYLPLAELCGLVPELQRVRRVLFFHENQWEYPVREAHAGERDHHFGFTQVVSAAAADLCLFNSEFNRSSFLRGARAVCAALPDHRPDAWLDRIEQRSEVMPLPVEYPELAGADAAAVCDTPRGPARAAGPLLLWNHRWEHDKDPDAFFAGLLRLRQEGVPFRVAVCGERFAEAPAVFDAARSELGDRVEHWGHLDDRAAYAALLARASVVVSTARHEFFGLAVLEAVAAGARPCVPDRLAYRELFPAEYRHRDGEDLVATLRTLCRDWCAGRIDLRADRSALTAPFAAHSVAPRWVERLRRLVSSGT